MEDLTRIKIAKNVLGDTLIASTSASIIDCESNQDGVLNCKPVVTKIKEGQDIHFAVDGKITIMKKYSPFSMYILVIFAASGFSCNNTTNSIGEDFRAKIVEKIKVEVGAFNDEIDTKNIVFGISGNLLLVNAKPIKRKLNQKNRPVLGYILFDYPGQGSLEMSSGEKIEKGLYQASLSTDTTNKTMSVIFSRGTQEITVPVDKDQVARQAGGTSCWAPLGGLPDCGDIRITSIHIDSGEKCITFDSEDNCKCYVPVRICLKDLGSGNTR